MDQEETSKKLKIKSCNNLRTFWEFFRCVEYFFKFGIFKEGRKKKVCILWNFNICKRKCKIIEKDRVFVKKLKKSKPDLSSDPITF